MSNNTTTLQTNVKLLNNCPLCDYSLEGLPYKHQCPECGFDYDREMELIKQSRKYSVFILVMTSMGIGFELIPNRWVKTLILLIILLLGGYKIYTDRRTRIILGPNGFTIDNVDDERQDYVWDGIGSIEYNAFGGGAKLLAIDGTKTSAISYEIFGSKRIVMRFIESATRWLTRYKINQQ